ncbi:GPW/gp25 family protein [Pontibacter toksunensis]|uniref:GPW/gp25 family protein n=1 Tax=Pontibacter toksunensis TaxID=1332631 RepID=A0ABW6BT74_9BACT
MKQQFYTLPLNFAGVMQKKEHPTCTLQQSVAQHLHLIITTAFGELPADERFGCSIWDHDFDNITSTHKIKEYIRQSLLSSIERYEKRLFNVRIDLIIKQEEVGGSIHGCRVKKKISITITGWLLATNEKFMYEDSFFTGPLSYQLI